MELWLVRKGEGKRERTRGFCSVVSNEVSVNPFYDHSHSSSPASSRLKEWNERDESLISMNRITGQ